MNGFRRNGISQRRMRAIVSPRALLPVALIAAVVGGATWLLIARPFAVRDIEFIGSGTIEIEDVDLGSRIGGRVTRVFVQPGDFVEADSPLIEFESTLQKARLAEAEAAVAHARANLALLEAGFRSEEIAAARARIEQATAFLDELKAGPRRETIQAAEAEAQALLQEYQRLVSETRRQLELEREGLSTPQIVEALTAQRDATQLRYHAAQKRLDELRAGTRPEQIRQAEAQLAEHRANLARLQAGHRPEEIEAARATVRAAEAHARIARNDLDETLVTAAMPGFVEIADWRPGDLIGPNQPTVRMVFPTRTYLRAFVPEKFLGFIEVGSAVEVGLTAAPELGRLPGRVTAIARQGEFTPRNTQTPIERARIVYEVRVQLTESLRSGMAANLYLPPERLAAMRAQSHR